MPAPSSNELIACAVAACLPDIDFLWGRHNMETHSVGFAVLVALGVYGLAQFGVTRERAALRRISSTLSQLALASGLAVVSHIVFDWLGSDDTPPLGVMALWPLTREYYFAYAYVFEAISRRYWLPNFFTHNLLAIAREVVILFPIAAALWVWRHRRGRLTGDT